MKKCFYILLFASGAVSGAFTLVAYISAAPRAGVGGEALIPLLLILLFSLGWYARRLAEAAFQSPPEGLDAGEDDAPDLLTPVADDTLYDVGYRDGYSDALETMTAGRIATNRPGKKRRGNTRRAKSTKQERSHSNGKKKSSVCARI